MDSVRANIEPWQTGITTVEGGSHEPLESEIDLVVDLNGEDESGLPWTFLDEARDPALVREGAWLVVGEGGARAVAQVVEIIGDVVRVRPLPGPVEAHRALLNHDVA